MKVTVIAATVLTCALASASLAVPGVEHARHTQAKRMMPPATEPPKQNELQGDEGETVEWDPISCWDCSRPDEPLAFFLAGQIMLTPIMILAMRARTKRNDAERARCVLGDLK